MAEIVRMPKLSDTMTEGTVSKWLKKVGDKVKSGEILAEIDSDKATMEFESFYNGTLLHIGIPEKKGAPVDAILAIIGKDGEDIGKILEQEKNKVPAKLVTYDQGGHGFGMRKKGIPVENWPQEMKAWLTERKLIK